MTCYPVNKEVRVETQHIQVEMTAELIQRIDDYRFAERFPSRAAAIRALLDLSLRQSETERQPKNHAISSMLVEIIR